MLVVMQVHFVKSEIEILLRSNFLDNSRTHVSTCHCRPTKTMEKNARRLACSRKNYHEYKNAEHMNKRASLGNLVLDSKRK